MKNEIIEVAERELEREYEKQLEKEVDKILKVEK